MSTTTDTIIDDLITGLEDEYGTIPSHEQLVISFGHVIGHHVSALIFERGQEVWRTTEIARLVAVGIPLETAEEVTSDPRYRGSILDGNAHLQARIASLRGN